MAKDPVLQALDALEAAIDGNVERARVMKERMAEIRAARADGRSYVDIVRSEAQPRIVQMVTESATALDSFGVQLRRAQARALYEEGLAMEEIAHLFGVTRQRVSALLARDTS